MTVQSWRDASLRFKTMLSFALVFAATLGLGLFTMTMAGRVDMAAERVRTDWLPSVKALGDLATSVEAVRGDEARLAVARLGGQHDVLAEAARDMQADIARADAIYAAYAPMIDAGTRDEAFMKAFAADWARYKADGTALQTAGTGRETSGVAQAFAGADRKDSDAAIGDAVADMRFNTESGIATAEAGHTTDETARLLTMTAIAVAALTAAAAGVVLVMTMVRPLRDATAALEHLAAGNLDVSIRQDRRADEIGRLVAALECFRNSSREARRLAAAEAAEQAAQAQRAGHLGQLTRDFEAHAGGLTAELAAGARSMRDTAQSMASAAEQTNDKAASVTIATRETSASVQTVAAAAEELSSSIREISRQVAQSSQMTGRAVEDARRTDAIVQTLAQGAEKIGQVVQPISQIAGQTNLLALNATIEAARAGEAGRGFAVVASEVKSLASQTARATEDISKQITGIQDATKEAVQAIKGIGQTINEISATATAIACAVEEQGAATAEIARNVQQTAITTQGMTDNIAGVSDAARDTGAAAGRVLGASGTLADQAGVLSDAVSRFVSSVRAA
jgi:methyl-accepting chemotaxis protein